MEAKSTGCEPEACPCRFSVKQADSAVANLIRLNSFTSSKKCTPSGPLTRRTRACGEIFVPRGKNHPIMTGETFGRLPKTGGAGHLRLYACFPGEAIHQSQLEIRRIFLGHFSAGATNPL